MSSRTRPNSQTDQAVREVMRAAGAPEELTERLIADAQAAGKRMGEIETFEIVLGERRGDWIARCYRESGEHVWSSEGAASVSMALREIAEAIERLR